MKLLCLLLLIYVEYIVTRHIRLGNPNVQALKESKTLIPKVSNEEFENGDV